MWRPRMETTWSTEFKEMKVSAAGVKWTWQWLAVRLEMQAGAMSSKLYRLRLGIWIYSKCFGEKDVFGGKNGNGETT